MTRHPDTLVLSMIQAEKQSPTQRLSIRVVRFVEASKPWNFEDFKGREEDKPPGGHCHDAAVCRFGCFSPGLKVYRSRRFS